MVDGWVLRGMQCEVLVREVLLWVAARGVARLMPGAREHAVWGGAGGCCLSCWWRCGRILARLVAGCERACSLAGAVLGDAA